MGWLKRLSVLTVIVLITACATSRDHTSSHYIADWENQFFNFPVRSEASGGNWAHKTAKAVGSGVQHVVLFPFAVLGNVAVNAYFIPTWPLRWLLRGDKRLIVWHPIFGVGEEVESDYFSKEWNRDLR